MTLNQLRSGSSKHGIRHRQLFLFKIVPQCMWSQNIIIFQDVQIHTSTWEMPHPFGKDSQNPPYSSIWSLLEVSTFRKIFSNMFLSSSPLGHSFPLYPNACHVRSFGASFLLFDSVSLQVATTQRNNWFMFLDIQADPSIPVLRNGPFQRPEIHFLLIQIVLLGRYEYIYIATFTGTIGWLIYTPLNMDCFSLFGVLVVM